MSRHLALMALAFTLTTGCSNTSVDEEATASIESVSGFILQTDVLDFSSRMTEQDTLTIHADLSACLSWHEETNLLIKKDGQVFIRGSVHGEYIEEPDKELERTHYDYLSADTLNFENLFRSMQAKGPEDGRTNAPVFTIIHKQDTVNYFSVDLMDLLHNIDHYIQIKRRLYPEAKVYQLVRVPLEAAAAEDE
jgi:hypothetical protein